MFSNTYYNITQLQPAETETQHLIQLWLSNSNYKLGINKFGFIVGELKTVWKIQIKGAITFNSKICKRFYLCRVMWYLDPLLWICNELRIRIYVLSSSKSSRTETIKTNNNSIVLTFCTPGGRQSIWVSPCSCIRYWLHKNSVFIKHIRLILLEIVGGRFENFIYLRTFIVFFSLWIYMYIFLRVTFEMLKPPLVIMCTNKS